MGKKGLALALSSELSGREKRPMHSAVLLAVGVVLLLAGFAAFFGPVLSMDFAVDHILRYLLLGFVLLAIGGILIGVGIIVRAGTHWLPRAAKLMEADVARRGAVTRSQSPAPARRNIGDREDALRRSARELVLQGGAPSELGPYGPPTVGSDLMAPHQISLEERDNHYEVRAWTGTDDWQSVRWRVEGPLFMVETTPGRDAPGSSEGGHWEVPLTPLQKATISLELPEPVDVTCALVDLSNGWLTVRLPKLRGTR